ncbi:deaminase [Arthrobacter sp. MYb211]|uniref:dihydrofolate reductase family protein n=1 Tax=unclassified Arthrobacter TaxID=235627 RepID=UPI000CFC4200|nr:MULTISPECIES: dihydrofolate reductase family protein [unclassified Arthrobacter]PRA01371.1 deaminase [Arthrobacter sp. MYb224]PRA12631.1 deaminase [Arthrobacter sp. MYb221]PRC09849.1 deaminase [Arthrobacter sp. MYb211]
MTSFKYYVGASIDGFVADQSGDTHWLRPFTELPGYQADLREFFDSIGAVVIGGKTYETIVRDIGEGHLQWPFGAKPVWIFTHHELPSLPDTDLTFIRGEISFWSRDIAKSAGAGDVWLVGGADLAGGFIEAGMLDELTVVTVPVFLGGGVNIFGRDANAQLSGLKIRELGDDIFAASYAVS